MECWKIWEMTDKISQKLIAGGRLKNQARDLMDRGKVTELLSQKAIGMVGR
jgi:hypothetical protein